MTNSPDELREIAKKSHGHGRGWDRKAKTFRDEGNPEAQRLAREISKDHFRKELHLTELANLLSQPTLVQNHTLAHNQALEELRELALSLRCTVRELPTKLFDLQSTYDKLRLQLSDHTDTHE